MDDGPTQISWTEFLFSDDEMNIVFSVLNDQILTKKTGFGQTDGPTDGPTQTSRTEPLLSDKRCTATVIIVDAVLVAAVVATAVVVIIVVATPVVAVESVIVRTSRII